jgi:hypothetical protein
MSRPTASPLTNDASPPNGNHRASEATTTSVKPCPRGACQPILLGADGPRACRERCARRPPPDQPAVKPFGGALRC